MSIAGDEDKRMEAMAISAFVEHHLIRRDDEGGRWLIAKKYPEGGLRGDMLTEIISLFGGRIFVGGDIDDCVFGHYSSASDSKGKDYHLAKLRWMGKQQGVSYYVAQKASIGMSDAGKLTEEYDQDVAEAQLREHAKDMLECGDYKAVDIEPFVEAAEDHCESSETLWEYLYRNIDDPCDLTGFGMITAPRVVYAWAAMRRLCEMLDEAELKVVR